MLTAPGIWPPLNSAGARTSTSEMLMIVPKEIAHLLLGDAKPKGKKAKVAEKA